MYTLPFCLWFKHWTKHIYVHIIKIASAALLVLLLKPLFAVSIKFNTCGSHHSTNPAMVSLQMMFCLFLAFVPFRKLCKYPSVLSAEGGISALFHRWENEAGWERSCWRSCAQQCQKLHQSSWLLNASWVLGFVFVLYFSFKITVVLDEVSWSDWVIFKKKTTGQSAVHYSIPIHIGSSYSLFFFQ